MTPERDALTCRTELLDRAFFDDPLVAYFLPDPVRRARLLPRFHRACLRHGELFGLPRYAENDTGLALWMPPKYAHMTLPQMFRSGIAQWGLSVGTGLPRLLRVEGILETMRRKYAPGPHWYLFLLAVDPEHHGEGIGAQLLEEGVARAHAEGLPVYLDTMTVPNVRFYTKRGFLVQEERKLSPDLTIWSLLNKP